MSQAAGPVAIRIVVDPIDQHLVDEGGWRVRPDGYVVRGKADYLHRAIMGCVPGDGRIVDHINGNRSDNRRSNLRIVSHAENLQNRRGPAKHSRSGVRNVYVIGQTGRYQVQFRRNGIVKHVGRFDTIEDAQVALAAALAVAQ